MFANAQGLGASNAEFNNIAGDMNKSACEFPFIYYKSNKINTCCLVDGKNFTFNWGNVHCQNFGNV